MSKSFGVGVGASFTVTLLIFTSPKGTIFKPSLFSNKNPISNNSSFCQFKNDSSFNSTSLRFANPVNVILSVFSTLFKSVHELNNDFVSSLI